MAIQFKRGTGTANDSYTGLDGEISVDFTNELLRVHNGTAAGGVFSVGASGAGSTDLSTNYTTTSFTIASSTGTDAVVNAATGSTAGALTSADKTKLDGIESGATADQTATEIKTAYESNADTNAYTDGEKTKLAGIEASADVNYPLSTAVQAQTGTDNTTVITPLRLFEGLAAGNWSVDFGVL